MPAPPKKGFQKRLWGGGKSLGGKFHKFFFLNLAKQKHVNDCIYA